MNRTFRLGPSLIFVTAITFGLPGCGNSGDSEKTEKEGASKASSNEGKEPDLSTPEKTLAAAKAAATKHDYSTLCGYFTPTARKDLAAGMVMMGGMMQAIAKKASEDPNQADPEKAERDRKRADGVKAVFEKHGLTEGNRPEINVDLNASSEEQKEQMRKLADPIEDHCQFFTDFVDVMRKQGTKQDAVMIEKNAYLDGLKIDGETANAEFVQTREERESRSPIAFQKMDGQWLISEVPNLLN